MSPFYLFRRALARRFFTSGYRLRFYRMLSLQMRNGVKLLDALEQISNMYTDFGRRTHGFGFLVDDCRVALTDNSGDTPCMWCAGKAIRSVILLVWLSTVMPAPHSGCRSQVLMKSIKPEPGGHNEKVCLVAECALVFLYLCGGG